MLASRLLSVAVSELELVGKDMVKETSDPRTLSQKLRAVSEPGCPRPDQASRVGFGEAGQAGIIKAGCAGQAEALGETLQWGQEVALKSHSREFGC